MRRDKRRAAGRRGRARSACSPRNREIVALVEQSPGAGRPVCRRRNQKDLLTERCNPRCDIDARNTV
jgi:hypothetical protein